MRRVLLIVLAASIVAGGVVCARLPEIGLAMVTPSEPFDAARVPPSPDYGADTAWLALPTRADEADVAIPQLPSSSSPVADVFYLHPTTSVAPHWNAAVDDAVVRQAGVRGGTLIQASAFNACCAVYAPEFRQATGAALVTPTADGDEALAVAYADVLAAYDEFSRRVGARPFILAGHSQGAALGARLLVERIWPSADRARLVAAYLIGAPLTPDELRDVPLCGSPGEVGCVVAYNARAPGHERNVLEIGQTVPEERRVCVNPVLGRATAEPAPASLHRGALFFDTETPALLPRFASSRCSGGRLVVDDMGELPPRDLPSRILLRVMGGTNLHPIEFQLFYADLRADAVLRVATSQSRGM